MTNLFLSVLLLVFCTNSHAMIEPDITHILTIKQVSNESLDIRIGVLRNVFDAFIKTPTLRTKRLQDRFISSLQDIYGEVLKVGSSALSNQDFNSFKNFIETVKSNADLFSNYGYILKDSDSFLFKNFGRNSNDSISNNSKDTSSVFYDVTVDKKRNERRIGKQFVYDLNRINVHDRSKWTKNIKKILKIFKTYKNYNFENTEKDMFAESITGLSSVFFEKTKNTRKKMSRNNINMIFTLLKFVSDEKTPHSLLTKTQQAYIRNSFIPLVEKKLDDLELPITFKMFEKIKKTKNFPLKLEALEKIVNKIANSGDKEIFSGKISSIQNEFGKIIENLYKNINKMSYVEATKLKNIIKKSLRTHLLAYNQKSYVEANFIF